MARDRTLHRYPPSVRHRFSWWSQDLMENRSLLTLLRAWIADYQLRRQKRAEGHWLTLYPSRAFDYQRASLLRQFRLRRLVCRCAGHKLADVAGGYLCRRCYQSFDPHGRLLGYYRPAGMKNGLIFGYC